jgi:hypothetical protein
MSLPLYDKPFMGVNWDKVLRLDGRTAHGRAFELLLRHKATAVDLCRPEIAGLDYRRRISDLRDMGIPVRGEPVDGKPYHRYSIPSVFVGLYWERMRKREIKL